MGKGSGMNGSGEKLTGAARHAFIPGDRLLPDPEILSKLFARDEQAIEWILDRMEQRQKEAFAEEDRKASLRVPFMKAVGTKAFWLKVFSHVTLFPLSPRHPHETAGQAINRAWAMTGNHMRGAIRDYMDVHNVPDSVLTPEDFENLKPLKLAP
jgi:hypothetical protein